MRKVSVREKFEIVVVETRRDVCIKQTPADVISHVRRQEEEVFDVERGGGPETFPVKTGGRLKLSVVAVTNVNQTARVAACRITWRRVPSHQSATS